MNNWNDLTLDIVSKAYDAKRMYDETHDNIDLGRYLAYMEVLRIMREEYGSKDKES